MQVLNMSCVKPYTVPDEYEESLEFLIIKFHQCAAFNLYIKRAPLPCTTFRLLFPRQVAAHAAVNHGDAVSATVWKAHKITCSVR